MSSFLEAMVLLLPPDVGGRSRAVSPRDGSYQPFTRIGEELIRLRVIEGPISLAPGEGARVVLECDGLPDLSDGAELPLIEPHDRVVGHVTVLRILGGAVVA
jgi:hypothetical protein